MATIAMEAPYIQTHIIRQVQTLTDEVGRRTARIKRRTPAQRGITREELRPGYARKS